MTGTAAQGADQTDAGNGTGAAAPPTGQDERVAELSREAGSYRTQRNTALREAHAYRTMLEAHGIDTTAVTADSLAHLPISAGKVDGQYAYTPPKVNGVMKSQEPARQGDGNPVTLSKEALEQMSPDEINKRWDEISAFMSKG